MFTRKTERFAENPFLKHVAETVKTSKKAVFSPTDHNKFLITNAQTGETVPGGVYFHREVEKNEFVKLYAEGAAAIMGLKAAGKKVFQIMYGQLLGREGKDRTEIPLKYELLSPEVKDWISSATFRRGIKELIEAQFIAESMLAGYFFVNPAFIFNGNRLLIAHAYTLKPETPEKAEKKDKKALKAAKQKELEEDQMPLPFDD